MSGIISQNVGRPSGLVKPVAAAGGVWTLIETITASSDSTIEFDSGIDSTYPIYVFKFINIHPENDDVFFQVNFRDGSTAYDASKTTTSFFAYANEADSDTNLAYKTSRDLANGTGVQTLSFDSVGNGNDESSSGELSLFNPSSTTFVKHFIARTQIYHDSDYIFDNFLAGYCNTTTAIDGVQFSMSSGDIDAGTFKMYGIGDS